MMIPIEIDKMGPHYNQKSKIKKVKRRKKANYWIRKDNVFEYTGDPPGKFRAGIVLRPTYVDDVIFLDIGGKDPYYEMRVDEALAIIGALSRAVWDYEVRNHQEGKNMKNNELVDK